MSLTLGLMGFGRIGRSLFRIAYKREDLRIGGISDIADHRALEYLLRFDSIYGRFPEPVRLEAGHLHVRADRVPMLQGREPGEVPWGDLGVDVVIEATGQHRSRADLLKHIEAGARRVIVCVQPRDRLDLTLVRGVNDDQLRPDHEVVSVGSCTANAAAPVLKVIHEAVGIDQVFLSTVHAYTNDQRVADVPHSDLRRSRAAAENIIPTHTNAGATIEEALPALAGRISASALKVPVPDGSVADMTLALQKPATAEEINATVYRAALGSLRGIIEYEDDPIVSRDVVGHSASGIFDSLATMALHSGLAKVLVWFTTSWGYAHRVLDVAQLMATLDAGQALPNRSA